MATTEDASFATVGRAARRMVLTFLVADAVLIASFLILFLSGYGIEVLAIGLERSIPNWYSAAKLLILAQLLAFIAWRASADTWRETLVLLAPALLFVLMSVEEVAAMRDRFERVLAPANEAGADVRFAFANTLLWGGALALALLAAGTAYARIIRPAGLVVAKALGGVSVFLLGAVGVELVFDGPGEQAIRILPAAAEEGAELVGVTLLIWAASDVVVPYLRAMMRGSEPRSA